MTTEEHRKRHIELHRALDELFADYIDHHPNKSSFSSLTVFELISWSHEQTIIPTEKEERNETKHKN